MVFLAIFGIDTLTHGSRSDSTTPEDAESPHVYQGRTPLGISPTKTWWFKSREREPLPIGLPRLRA
jgi:hypothetical protein